MVAPTAPFALDVTLLNLEPLLKKMKDPRLITVPAQGMLSKAVLIGEREARNEAPKDTARLTRSLATEVIGLGGRIFFLNEQLYFQVQESGRRAGAAPPPAASLLPWMRRKGIAPELAFVIARAIGRRGLKGRFFMRKGAQAIQRETPKLMRDLMSGVRKEWLR